MEQLYVYDFDETIYDGDVTRDFHKFCFENCNEIKKLNYFISVIFALIKYIFGIYRWTEFKSEFLGYWKYINNIESVLDEFWEGHKSKIKKWYLEKDHSNDVIISASPEFLLEKICYDYLKVKLLIGTLADKKNGNISGNNCYGSQKVLRLNEKIKNYHMLEFYSDSLSDSPLAKLADKSFIVIGDELVDWKAYELPKTKELKSLFFSRDFILFILIGVINTFNGVIFALMCSRWISGVMMAFWAGYILSNIIAYLLNSLIIFKEKLSILKYIKFFISYIPNLLIQTVIVFVMMKIFGLNEDLKWVAYLISAVIGVPITFLCLKLFAFKPKDKKEYNPYAYREL